MLDDRHLRFAKQCGATHIITHLVDYFHQGSQSKNDRGNNQPIGTADGWGTGGSNSHVWEIEFLKHVKEKIESHGLKWYGVENFDPAHWYDILLAGPRRDEQIAFLQKIIRNLGEIGVEVMGYNFSLAGVSSRVTGPFARGGAESVGMEGVVDERPIPRGMIWNMIYDQDLLSQGGDQVSIGTEELWDRLAYFLHAMIPVAESSGVKLAAHPDDPPAERVRRQPRLVYKPELYQRLLDIRKSPFNTLELCLGTLQEMPGESVYPFLKDYLAQDCVPYIHLRNVRGKVPHYKEVFIDEGDIDVPKVLRILKESGSHSVIIPDHTPAMDCSAPWYAGMAFTMGYLRALLQTSETSI